MSERRLPERRLVVGRGPAVVRARPRPTRSAVLHTLRQGTAVVVVAKLRDGWVEIAGGGYLRAICLVVPPLSD